MSLALIPNLLVALLISVGLVWLLDRPARRFNLVDHPGGRKTHAAPTPLIGGIAVFGAFLIAVVTVDVDLVHRAALFAAMLLLLLCGVIDDLVDLKSTTKFAGQIAAALLVVAWGGMVVNEVAYVEGFGSVALGAWAMPLTLLGVVGLVNAVNMLDGLDGLAGGASLAMLLWLAIAAHLNGLSGSFMIIAVLASALAGFLAFNVRHPLRRKAAVFLGDSGSMLLGLAIAWFCIDVARAGADAPISPIAIGWIIALPVMDTVSLFLRRLLKRQSPFSADREHLHHIFMRAGYTAGQASWLLVLIAFAFGGVGIFLSIQNVPDPILALGLLVAIGLHFVFIRYAWRTIRALRRLGARRSRAADAGLEMRDTGCLLAPPIAGWRRCLALVGLYLMVAAIPLSVSMANIGLILVLAATLASLGAFLRDMINLPLFWLALLLTVYAGVMSWLGAVQAPELAAEAVPHWRHVLRVTILLSLPAAWWLAGARFHWTWLFWTLIAAATASFMMNANWNELLSGEIGDPDNFGSPDEYAPVAACVLVILFAVTVAAIGRLGRGWRPVFTLIISLAAGLPMLLLLVVSDYTTAWLGAAIGIATVGTVAVIYGINRRQWASLLGGIVVILGVALSTGLALRDGATVHAELGEPIKAAALYAGGEPELARERHAPTADRLLLWSQALARTGERPVFGWGVTAPAPTELPNEVRSDDSFRNFFLSFLVGYGIVGLVLFMLINGVLVRRLKRATQRHLLPTSISVVLYGVLATLASMLLLSTQINHTASRTLLIMMFSLLGAVAVMRHWERLRRRHCRRYEYLPERAERAAPELVSGPAEEPLPDAPANERRGHG